MIGILKIFIKVMESGIAFSLIMAILFAYYRIENINKKRLVFALSVTIGIVAGIISAIIRQIPNLINRTNLNFYSMLPVVISLIGIITLMILENRIVRKNKKIYENLFTLFFMIYVISSFFYYLPPLFIQLNSFVYYGESAVSTIVLFRIIGYVLGIIMIICSSVALYNTSKRLSNCNLKLIVAIALLIRGINQIIVVIQRLYSLRLIPRSNILFKIIAFVINYENYLTYVIMAFIVIAPIILIKQNIRITEKYSNNAELRKIKYRMKVSRNWSKFLIVLLLGNVFAVTFGNFYITQEQALSPPEEYSVIDGHAEIPLTSLEDMHLHRYEYKAKDGTMMRFILIKKSENSYGVCLDACEICGPSGYFERGDNVVCKLCDVVMNRGTIGFKGGCNPIPIPYKVHDGKIKISTIDLDNNSGIFR